MAVYDIRLGDTAKAQYRHLMERVDRPIPSQEMVEQLGRVRSLVQQISDSRATDQQIIMPATATDGPGHYLYRSEETTYVFFRRTEYPIRIAFVSMFCELNAISAAHILLDMVLKGHIRIVDHWPQEPVIIQSPRPTQSIQ